MTESTEFPSQAETLKFVKDRWPDRVAPIWRASKVAEESGEILGALNKPWKTPEDVEQETAQLVICAMALAESVGFDLWNAVIEEWQRAIVRKWPT